MIAIFGANGNMGRRYRAVCDYLGIEHKDYDVEYDYEKPINPHVEKVIIATPINSHVKICQYCACNGIDFLCEKPISKNVDEVKYVDDLCKNHNVNGFMVNNWKFVLAEPYKSSAILYNHFTGNDGIWDLIQPIHYLKKFEVKTCPYFALEERIDGKLYRSIRGVFDKSYILMILDFVNNKYSNLMPIWEAVEATQKIQSLIESGKQCSLTFQS